VIEHDFAEFGNILGSGSKTIWIEYTSLHATLNIEKGQLQTSHSLYRLIEHCKICWKSLMLPACSAYCTPVRAYDFIVQTGFRYAHEIDAAPRAIRDERFTEAVRRGSSIIFIFPLLARKSAEKKGGHVLKRMGRCRDRWKDRRTTYGL